MIRIKVTPTVTPPIENTPIENESTSQEPIQSIEVESKKIKNRHKGCNYNLRKPQRYTEEQVLQALKDAQGGLYYAAELLDMHYSTLLDYFKRYPELKKQAKLIKRGTIDRVVYKLEELAEAGDIKAIVFYLSCQAKHLGYGPVNKRGEETNTTTPVVTPKDIKLLSPEKKLALVNSALEHAGLPILEKNTPLQIGLKELQEQHAPTVVVLPDKELPDKESFTQ